MAQQRRPADSSASPNDLRPLLSQEEWRSVVRELALTPRQSQIVERVLQAKKDKQIATELEVEISTVRMHLRHIYARLRVHDRMELALQVFRIVRNVR